MGKTSGEDLLNSERAARYLGCARTTLHNRVWRKEIKPIRRGSQRPVFERAELNRYLSARGLKPADPNA